MKRKYPVIDTAKTGNRIRTLMKEKGYTVKDLQIYLGLGTTQAIYHWFRGKSMPTMDNFYALSELFRIPVDGLLRGNRRFVYIPFADDEYKRIYTYYEKLILS